MLIHSFQFFNELELLPLKLEELWDVVDKFILIEATNTFSNLPKPLHYEQNKGYFEQYHSKIDHRIVTLPDGPDPWIRERYQRDVGIQFATSHMTSDQDVILISDMDEIVSAAGVRAWLDGETGHVPTALKQKFYYYYLNNYADLDWTGGRIARIGDLRYSLSEFRADPGLPVITNGGWHFSFLGGASRIQTKVLSYAHFELLPYVIDRANLSRALETGSDIFGRDIQFRFTPIDESYPVYVLEHLDDYQDMIKEI